MKQKIISLLLVLIAVVAFSGVASATYVTNSGTKTINHGSYKDIWTYSILHYNSKHVVVRTKLVTTLYYSGAWHSSSPVTLNIDFKRTSKTKVKVTTTSKAGTYTATKKGYIYLTTSVSAFAKKYEKTLIKAMT